jgi:hypothetical protein
MSISSNNKMTNPSKKFIEWNGELGKFFYYDKEKKEKVDMPSKFQVIGLDELSTIKGYDADAESGIYSNEVRSTLKEEMTVKNFKGDLIAKGIYQDIKGNLSGGKYTKSIYAVRVSKDGTTELVNLSIKGSALGPWIDAKINVSEGFVITCGTSPEQKKKGKTVYYEPEFSTKPLPSGTVRDTVVQIDSDILQPYLNQYLSAKPESAQEKSNEAASVEPSPAYVVTPITDDITESQELPF